MSAFTCPSCGAENRTGTLLCKACRVTLSVSLATIAEIHGQLLGLGHERVKIRTSSSSAADPTGNAAGKPAAPSPGAELAAAVKATLVSWAMVLLEESPQQWPADTVQALATFLRRNLTTIAGSDWCAAMLDELLGLEARMKRLIASHQPNWYAGVCSAVIEPEREHDQRTCVCACHTETGAVCDIEGGCNPGEPIPAETCTQDLYGQPGETYVTCPACSTQWLLHQRRHIMLEAMREMLLPLPEIARLAVVLVEDETSTQRLLERLNKRVSRDTLRHRSVVVVDGRPVRHYEFGDVLDTLSSISSHTRG